MTATVVLACTTIGQKECHAATPMAFWPRCSTTAGFTDTCISTNGNGKEGCQADPPGENNGQCIYTKTCQVGFFPDNTPVYATVSVTNWVQIASPIGSDCVGSTGTGTGNP